MARATKGPAACGFRRPRGPVVPHVGASAGVRRRGTRPARSAPSAARTALPALAGPRLLRTPRLLLVAALLPAALGAAARPATPLAGLRLCVP